MLEETVIGLSNFVPTAAQYAQTIVREHGITRVLDIGCGLAPRATYGDGVFLTGIDTPDVIHQAKGFSVLYPADFNVEWPEVFCTDLVTAFGVIEHLPRKRGWELLEWLELASKRFVVLEAPNGFFPQRAINGNPYQHHLSGWFAHDFESCGYKVYGTTGCHFLHGEEGKFTPSYPGDKLVDAVLALMLRIRTHPDHAANLVAIKDLKHDQN